MYKNKWNFEEAFKYMKQVRPLTNPNQGFIKQLIAFENDLGI